VVLEEAHEKPGAGAQDGAAEQHDQPVVQLVDAVEHRDVGTRLAAEHVDHGSADVEQVEQHDQEADDGPHDHPCPMEAATPMDVPADPAVMVSVVVDAGSCFHLELGQPFGNPSVDGLADAILVGAQQGVVQLGEGLVEALARSLDALGARIGSAAASPECVVMRQVAASATGSHCAHCAVPPDC
jgi:hypothetical protein